MIQIRTTNFQRNIVIYLLSAIGFFGIFSTTISKNPVLPLFVNAMGANDAMLGIIAAVSPLAGIVFSFPVGFLIDRIGRRKLMYASALAFLCAPLLYIFVTSPLWLIPIRFFHGLATAILNPLATTIIFDRYIKDKGEKLGLYSSATLVGRTLAPLLGGFIITYFLYLPNLWNYRLVYFAAFLAAIPIALFALWLQYYTEDVHNGVDGFKSKDLFTALRKFIDDKKLLSTSLVEMSVYFNFGVLETYLPIYLHEHNVSGSKIGIIFTLQILAIALTKPVFGRVADRIDKRMQVIVGMMIIAASMMALPFLHNYWFIVGLSIMFGLGMSVSTIATNSHVGDIVKKQELGSSMGALSSIMDVGHSSGPFVAGFIITYLSFSLGFLFASAVALLTTLYFFFGNYRFKSV